MLPTALALTILMAAVADTRPMVLMTSDFENAAGIPRENRYPRCGGSNVSPELLWAVAPAAAKSFVVTMVDDTVTPHGWSHWLVVDIPPGVHELPRGVRVLPAPAKAIVSNFGDAFYDGPCPPPGSGMHHYRLTVWAMPVAHTTIAPDAKADQVIADLTKTALAHAAIGGWASPD